MEDLDHIVKDYAAFEAEVRAYSSELWFQWCSNCRKVCCNAIYCRETLDSPFLQLLLKQQPQRFSASIQNGWLGEAGCQIPVGRPAVCYEFLCGDILEATQTRMQRYAMIVLSKLISHIGKRALGSRHLIELMNPAELKRVKYSRFKKRLSEARNAFEIVQLIFNGGKTGDDALNVLSKISNPGSVKGE
jgi:hypothetical protein